MADSKYRVSSPEGAVWSGAEEGEEITRDLDDEQELALLAAGWLEKSSGAKKASS